MKTNTILNQLQQLPEPYNEKALKACRAASYNTEGILSVECETPEDAVLAAFVWDLTEEGYQYWSDFYNFLITKHHDHDEGNLSSSSHRYSDELGP
jgi:hypothetical protein